MSVFWFTVLGIQHNPGLHADLHSKNPDWVAMDVSAHRSSMLSGAGGTLSFQSSISASKFVFIVAQAAYFDGR